MFITLGIIKSEVRIQYKWVTQVGGGDHQRGGQGGYDDRSGGG